jgi:apolipoprotein N-acyltransferase
MRAVENRRWLLRDTNTGLTTIIDPYGRLTASVGRHALTSLAAKYGYRSDLTFYTRHGDLFAYLCGIITVGILVAALVARLRRPMTAFRTLKSRRMAGSAKAHVE